jgi:hypothetical protein
MFTPLAYPYVRAQTYVDSNPPAVLSDEFYNPTQDAIARIYGAHTGYSTSLSYEEFERYALVSVPVIGSAFGEEMAVLSVGGSTIGSANATGPNEHGIIEIAGQAPGARGGAPGFQVADAERNLGTKRWIQRWRVRCSKFSVLTTSPPGLVVGLGTLASTLPSWVADGTAGFWNTFWDGGATTTTLATTDGEWVDLWITLEDADGICRWYYKRDADPLPSLADTQTLATTNLVGVRRYLQNIVTAGASDIDYVQVDAASMGCER